MHFEEQRTVKTMSKRGYTRIYFGFCGVAVHFWEMVGSGGYILAGGGWWWVVVNIFWLVVGGGGWSWVVVGRSGWWHSLV